MGREPPAARFFVAGPPQKKEGLGTGDHKGRPYGEEGENGAVGLENPVGSGVGGCWVTL